MSSNKTQQVPFLDLKAQALKVGAEIKEVIDEIIDNATYILGPAVDRFEKEFATYCEVKYAVCCNSGTSALHLALRALNIGPGDEIITVSHTFIATSWAISYCGAKPVFIDIDPATRAIDSSQIEQKITPRTKAIIPVHIYGHPADMDPIISIADRYGLFVVEDAAQAHGARYKGKRIGSFGTSGCFSFYPGKNIGAYGEGGAVVTNDKPLAEMIRILRNHGQAERFFHETIGYNYRMDGIQGAVLGIKLKYLDQWNAKRRELAALYHELLSDVDSIILPVAAEWAEPVFHLYVIQDPDRDDLARLLAEKGISTGLHYPIPIHLQKAYTHLNMPRGSLPVTEQVASTCLSLPIFPEMTSEMVYQVCEAVKSIVKGSKHNG
jgi:dTDP-4-amino-4,6-dideoxygalactose transaminase